MRMYDLILKKREGGCLTESEINYIVKGYTQGSIPDYQMSAFLMAVYFKGELGQSVRFIRTWNCRRLAVWFLGLMSCLVDVTGFVFGVHNLLAPVQTKVSGEHIAESDSQKKIWHAVITEQFKTD